jgi:urease accessory protein
MQPERSDSLRPDQVLDIADGGSTRLGVPRPAALPHDLPGDDPHAHLAHGGRLSGEHGPLRIGIGGPVGSGKTALVAALCRVLGPKMSLGVVTNDIYTTEDADFLRRNAVLPDERIVAVQTGCCPHTAIRDDITANLDAVDDLIERLPPLDLVLVESGGDNLTASFSKGLVDVQIFVVDVAGGDKVPRKGGPGVTTADLLVINKTDLAPFVGADLTVMAGDAHRVRGTAPVVLQSLREDPQASDVASWVMSHLDMARLHPATTVAAS